LYVILRTYYALTFSTWYREERRYSVLEIILVVITPLVQRKEDEEDKREKVASLTLWYIIMAVLVYDKLVHPISHKV
jgi:hypothetical protein